MVFKSVLVELLVFCEVYFKRKGIVLSGYSLYWFRIQAPLSQWCFCNTLEKPFVEIGAVVVTVHVRTSSMNRLWAIPFIEIRRIIIDKGNILQIFYVRCSSCNFESRERAFVAVLSTFGLYGNWRRWLRYFKQRNYLTSCHAEYSVHISWWDTWNILLQGKCIGQPTLGTLRKQQWLVW